MCIKNHENQLYNILLLLATTNLVFMLGEKLFSILPAVSDFLSKKIPLSDLDLPAPEAEKLKLPNYQAVEEALSWMMLENHHIITIYDDRYPELLKEIPNPPILLFVKGDVSLLKNKQISIVGSRNPTHLGLETTNMFAKELVEAGLLITSGFASGIDAAAHVGAIDAGGRTIAVMGTGLHNIYPKSQAFLLNDIIKTGGVILSEFFLDDKAKAWHFPLRNRIISGLSIGTVVIEAALKSGSLITARLAAEQGRDVFVVPGSIYNSKSRGCHYLIRQGARLVEKPTDILEEIPDFFYNQSHKASARLDKIQVKNKLDCKHEKLLDCMGFERVTADILVTRTKMPISWVSSILLELEMRGLVKSVLGGYLRL